MNESRDISRPCTSCGGPVKTSQVVRWPEAARLFWFLTGVCRVCQQ
jgi:hypothetical protein